MVCLLGLGWFPQQDQQQELPCWVKSKAAGIVTSYPLVISHSHGKSPFFMGKSTRNGDFP